MSKTPPIPEAQKKKYDDGPARPQPSHLDPSRDQSGINLDEQGAPGNLHQNLTPQRTVQDR